MLQIKSSEELLKEQVLKCLEDKAFLLAEEVVRISGWSLQTVKKKVQSGEIVNHSGPRATYHICPKSFVDAWLNNYQKPNKVRANARKKPQRGLPLQGNMAQDSTPGDIPAVSVL